MPDVLELQTFESTLEVVEEAGGLLEVAIAPGPPGPQGPAGDAASIEGHLADPTPHAAYDDLPSLTLIFENGLI